MGLRVGSKAPRWDTLASGPRCGRSQLDAGAGDLLWPTLQWIFFLGLIFVLLKYITKETYPGCGVG